MEEDAARALDREARLAAQRIFDRPLLVEAGAGTGKTTTLVARVLAWSLGPGWERARERQSARGSGFSSPGAPAPSEEVERERLAASVLRGVVAITFTEAAAAEMATRTARGLAEIAEIAEIPETESAETAGAGSGLQAAEADLPSWLDPSNLPERAELARRARALLGTLDHLVVRTIHAFCRSLLAVYPIEAGRHPVLSVDADGRVLEAVVHEVVEASLREGYGDPGDPGLLALAARGFGPPQIVEALAALVEGGLPAAALEVDPLGPEPTAALARRLAEAAAALARPLAARLRFAGGRRGTVHQVAEGLERLLARLASSQPAGDGPPADLASLCAWTAEALPGRTPERLRQWEKNRLSSKGERDLLGDLLPELSRAAGVLGRLLDHLARLDPELLGCARRALAPLLARVEREMRSRGAETFGGLLSGAAALLAQKDVRSRVRRGIDQLLVDEFQDTDRLQCEILRWLALDGPLDERPGLFLVGDPKQSIYGWRSADLRAYDGFAGLVREAGGEVLWLVENFRSVPPILEEVGRVVAPVMRERAGVQPRYEPLLACESRRAEAAFDVGGRRPVEYWISWSAEAGPGETGPGDAVELEAAALAADLADLHAGGVPWRECAVLLRSGTDLDLYLEALRRTRIPFRVGRDRQYYRRREVIEAAALVRAVLDPGDHLALLTVLRSPLAGVPDAALIPLWRQSVPRLVTELIRPSPERQEQLAAAVRAAARELPAGVPGLDRVRGWEENLLAALAHLALLRHSFATDPADLFVEKLRRLSLAEPVEAARYLGAYRLANLERFFRRLLQALEEGKGDAAAVLRLLRRGVATGEEAEEGRPQEGGEDEVSVLTMHGAKGLDFGHVYLVQLHKQTNAERGPKTEVGPPRETKDREGQRGGGFPEYRPEHWPEYRLFGAATTAFDEVEAERDEVEAAERVRTLYVAMTRAKQRLVLLGLWPPGDEERSPERARHHVDLLAGRAGSGERGEGRVSSLAALWEELRQDGRSAAVDEVGALWRFPALAGGHEGEKEDGRERRREDAGGGLPGEGRTGEPGRETQGEGLRIASSHVATPALPGPAELAREAAALQVRREAAARRRQRRINAPASEEAHERLRDLASVRRLGAEPGEEEELPLPGPIAPADPAGRTGKDERDAALAAGGAVHRALETWDLAADPRHELARQRELLPAYLAALSGGGDTEGALRRARNLLDRFAGGPLLPRLRDLADGVLARELPVLLGPDRPGEEPGEKNAAPLGYIAGAIDLLYRDPGSGELVVADYKTDDLSDGPALTARAAAYAPQGAAYARAVREALALSAPPRFELWFLRPGRVVPVEIG